MTFTSFSFVVFALVFAAAWPFARQRRPNFRWGYLTAFSLFFYGYWDWRFVFLLIATGLIDFWAALLIEAHRRHARLLLGVSMATNLGVLFFFKYAAFFAGQTAHWLAWPSPEQTSALARIVLPVGISFYTFQSMSYTIDVYRRELPPTRNALHFFAYLSLFPQLVAGPIVRAADFLPQLLTPGDYRPENRWRGLELITLGFVKKMVIADNAAPLVADLFAGATGPSGASAWIGALFFALQILCDFSGYSDIARGLARWMGYDFVVNFDRPYVALGFRDFWRRWHISLSTWFRDYVYVPLGGSRGSRARQWIALWVTFLASGLWHGANWTFLLWGALHAFFLSVERLTRWPERVARFRGGAALGITMTFLLTLLAWVPFRAATLPNAWQGMRAMILQPHVGWAEALARLHAGHLLSLGGATLLAIASASHRWSIRALLATHPRARFILVVLGLLMAVFLRGPGHAFIYFQF